MKRKSTPHHSQPLRTSDIARAVGVHPNTVRLYEEWGYLPPLLRSSSGYRQFDERHLAQMKLARLAFEDPYPGRHIRRSLAGLVRLAAQGELVAAAQAAHAHGALILAEIAQSEAASAYLEEWVNNELQTGHETPGLLPGQAAALLAVTKDTLRHWERSGLIEPPRDPHNGYRRYGAQELGRLRVLRLLTRAGYSTMAVLRTVRSLDGGQRDNLGELLDLPAGDEDAIHAADRWLTTLREHELRSGRIINQLAAMIARFAGQTGP